MGTPERRAAAGISLAKALIDTSPLPLLLLDGDLRVVTASPSFCAAFEIAATAVEGRMLVDIGDGEWNLPELASLLGNTLSGEEDMGPYETDLARGKEEPRRLILNVQQVADDPGQGARLLLTVHDVTDTQRADRQIVELLFEKDDLLRERAVLLQEMQHRVANSLQIIASVLMLKARAVKSEESRAHLQDAHDRVMSVAAVQQHLQATVGDVELEPYLTKLCVSLASSMIRESRPLILEVQADAATVTSREAVSLGLIVTELVINALKHAFPEGRGGHVVVGYHAAGGGWALSITDDGVGRPPPSPQIRVGLGTGVVEALARQLHARVVISDACPGARIEIVSLEAMPSDAGRAARWAS
jgi:two-component sensor histidine kinase